MALIGVTPLGHPCPLPAAKNTTLFNVQPGVYKGLPLAVPFAFDIRHTPFPNVDMYNVVRSDGSAVNPVAYKSLKSDVPLGVLNPVPFPIPAKIWVAAGLDPPGALIPVPGDVGLVGLEGAIHGFPAVYGTRHTPSWNVEKYTKWFVVSTTPMYPVVLGCVNPPAVVSPGVLSAGGKLIAVFPPAPLPPFPLPTGLVNVPLLSPLKLNVLPAPLPGLDHAVVNVFPKSTDS